MATTFWRELASNARLVTDDGVMSEVACRSRRDLKPLDPGLKPEVREWADGARKMLAAAGLSVTEFAAQGPIDKGAISRILSGKRVPCDRWFLDRLLAEAARNGKPVTPEVREHFSRLQLRALAAAHPDAYKVRLLRDELEIAVTARREAERHVDDLVEKLNERDRQIQELIEEENRLRAAWDLEYGRLTGEINQLTTELDFARQRAAAAEERCAGLGSMLDLVEQIHPDQRQEGDHPHSIDWDSAVSNLPLDDLNAVDHFLMALLRLDLRDYAGALASRVVAHFSSQPLSSRSHFSDDVTKRDGLLRVLATMWSQGFDDHARALSNWMGYPISHRRPRIHFFDPPPS